jgi:hypothetical protein
LMTRKMGKVAKEPSGPSEECNFGGSGHTWSTKLQLDRDVNNHGEGKTASM